jgi:hypothetical protein
VLSVSPSLWVLGQNLVGSVVHKKKKKKIPLFEDLNVLFGRLELESPHGG